ncbi:hypothetical protein BDV18DRAFT_162143 [Aspergillus unguis]
MYLPPALQNTPSLESLPRDILILILSSLPDRKTLKHTIHASPSSHRAYLASQRAILKSILVNYHDGLVEMSDAITAVRSQDKPLTDADKYEDIVELLDGRKREIRDCPANATEIVRLLRLHEVGMWFLKDFEVNMSCPHWMSKADWFKLKPLRLSRDERVRFFRAFHRLEIWTNIFGNLDIVDEHDYDADTSEGLYQMVDLFFLTIPPWETEEIACFWNILHLRLLSVFSSYVDKPEDELSNFAMKGPRAVHRAIKRMSLETPGTATRYKVHHCKDEEQILFFKENAFEDLGEFDFKHEQNQFHYPASQYEGHNPWKFKQQIAGLPIKKRPNALWEREFVNKPKDVDLDRNFLYGHLLNGCDVSRAKWGWVFWDKERIKEWKIIEKKVI